MLRTLAGFFIGLLVGGTAGGFTFAIAENFFGRGVGFLWSSPAFAAILGFALIGLPSAVIGGVVGAYRAGTRTSLIAGLVAGALMAISSVATNDRQYSYSGGYFDTQMLYNDVIIDIAFLILPCVASVAVSASVQKLFAKTV